MNASGPELHLPTISQSFCLLFYLQKWGVRKNTIRAILKYFFSVVVLELHKNNWNSILEAEMNLKLACNAYFPDMSGF
jgi:hypothetical protein